MTAHLPIPSPAQLAWQRTETNLFIHFGMNTFTGREWGDGSEAPALFNPQKLDCRQWAQVAKAGGFQIAVLTAKHHDGFCLWPSRYTSHSVKSSPWKDGKGDVVREFVDAFRAEGIKVGLYLSPWDRHEPAYGSEFYNDFYCQQLNELLTEYGELHEVWFDGACAEGPNGKIQQYDWPRYFDLVKKLQPGAVTFGDGGTDVRWVGNERGFAGETCWATVNPEVVRFPGDSGIAQANDARADVDKEKFLNEGSPSDGQPPLVWSPAECDVSIRPGWFYHEKQDAEVRPVENLLELYFQSVGRNGTLLLNIPATRDGLLPAVDAANVAEFRQRLEQIFANNLARGAKATAADEWPDHPARHTLDGDSETFWATSFTQSEAAIELAFSEDIRPGIIVLQEPVRHGQSIAEHRVEALNSAGDWEIVSTGTTVGHKRIHQFEPLDTRGIRVVIAKAFTAPALSSIALYPAISV